MMSGRNPALSGQEANLSIHCFNAVPMNALELCVLVTSTGSVVELLEEPDSGSSGSSFVSGAHRGIMAPRLAV